MKFRKLPVEIDAEQYTEYGKLVKGMCNSQLCFTYGNTDPHVHTIHDNQMVKLEVGDWVIPEPDGIRYYPCKPDIFAKTYELAEDQPKAAERDEAARNFISCCIQDYNNPQATEAILRYFKAQQPAPTSDWISVEERLPENAQDVLIVTDNGVVIPATFDKAMGEFQRYTRNRTVGDRIAFYHYSAIDLWKPMPLPFSPPTQK